MFVGGVISVDNFGVNKLRESKLQWFLRSVLCKIKDGVGGVASMFYSVHQYRRTSVTSSGGFCMKKVALNDMHHRHSLQVKVTGPHWKP